MVDRITDFTAIIANPTTSTGQFEFSWTNPSGTTKVRLVYRADRFPKSIDDAKSVLFSVNGSIGGQNYNFTKTIDGYSEIYYFSVFAGDSKSLNSSYLYGQNSDVGPVSFLENYNLKALSGSNSILLKASHDGNSDFVDGVLIIRSTKDYQGTYSVDNSGNIVADRNSDEVILLHEDNGDNIAETFEYNDTGLSANVNYYYKIYSIANSIQNAQVFDKTIIGKNIATAGTNDKSAVPQQVTGFDFLDSETNILVDTSDLSRSKVKQKGTFDTSNPFTISNPWQKLYYDSTNNEEVSDSESLMDISWINNSDEVLIQTDNDSRITASSNPDSDYESGYIVSSEFPIDTSKFSYSSSNRIEGMKQEASGYNVFRRNTFFFGQIKNDNITNIKKGLGIQVFTIELSSERKYLSRFFYINANTNTSKVVDNRREDISGTNSLNLDYEINFDNSDVEYVIENDLFNEKRTFTDTISFNKNEPIFVYNGLIIFYELQSTKFFIDSVYTDFKLTNTDNLILYRNQSENQPKYVSDLSQVDKKSLDTDSDYIEFNDTGVSNDNTYNYAVFSDSINNNISDTKILTIGNVTQGGVIVGQKNLFPDSGFKIDLDSTYYKNGDNIQITARLKEKNLTVEADLSKLDSTKSSNKDLNFLKKDGDAFLYRNTFTISENNTKSDGFHDIEIIANDGISTSKETSQVYLDNTAPSKIDISDISSGATSSSPITFDWDSISDPSGVKYKVQVSNDQSSGSIVDEATVNNSKYDFDEVIGGESYSIRVNTIDGAGNKSGFTDWSNNEKTFNKPFQIKSLKEISKDNKVYADGDQINLKMITNREVNLNNSSIDFSPIDDASSSPVKEFNYINNSKFEYTVTHSIANSNSISDGDYTITASAQDNSGNSSTKDIILTLDNSPPGTVSISDNGNDIGKQPKFSWTTSADQNFKSQNIVYELQVSKSQSTNDIVHEETLTGFTEAQFFKAEPQMEYYARVRPIDPLDNKASWTSWTDGVVWDVPKQASNLKLIADADQIEIEWKNPNNNLSEVGIVRRTDRLPKDHNDGTDLHRVIDPNDGGIDSYIDTNVNTSTTYYYGVYTKAPSGYWNDTTPTTGDVID